MYYYTMGDVVIKDENLISVFILDDRLIEDVDCSDVGAPMIIYYADGDVYIYDDVISFEETDRGFWVETHRFNFRFDNHYDDEEDSLDWLDATEEPVHDDEFDF